MKDLLILNEIEKEKGNLVERAENFLDANFTKELTDTQLQNVVNIANSTTSMAVLLNFIKYQIGRRDEWQSNNIGENLLRELESLSTNTKAVVKRLNEKEVIIDEEEEKEITIQLARLYLGFLNRYFKYKSK